MHKVLLLALGTFALGLDAFIVAGLIPDISAQIGVTEAEAGQMVTVFTLSYAVSGPLLSSVLKSNTKTLLLSAMAVFTVGNVASALADSFPLLLAARVIAGIGAGLYSPTAAATAAQMVPPQRRGRALSLILAGLSAGTVIGVPVGLVLAEHMGWRSAFWWVSAVGILSTAAIAAFIPRLHIAAPPGFPARLATLTDRRVTPIVIVTLLFNIASLGLYTYIAPILQATAGITRPTALLWVWGIGGIVGAITIGFIVDRSASATRVMPFVLGLFIAAAAAVTPAGTSTVLVAMALGCWGAAGFASPPPQQHLLLERAPDVGAIAVAVNGSAIYLGSALGSAAAGAALGAGMPIRYLPPLAAGIAGLALLAYLTLVIRPPLRT
ncbi:MAG: MFS transporter [Mycobacterium sp.]|nr:MFS transporter [Mycobacterium sp.]